MTIDLATTKPLERLNALVAEVIRLGQLHPDHASDCVYTFPTFPSWSLDDNVPEGVTGCIIGTAMRNLGHPVPDSLEGVLVPTVVPQLLSTGATGEARQLNWLYQVQREQDQGYTWGEAIKAKALSGWKPGGL